MRRGTGGLQVIKHCAGRPQLEPFEVFGGFDLFRHDDLDGQNFFRLHHHAVGVQFFVHQGLKAEVLDRVFHFPRLTESAGDAEQEGRGLRLILHIGRADRPHGHNALAHNVVDVGAFGEFARTQQIHLERAFGARLKHFCQFTKAVVERAGRLGPVRLHAPVYLTLCDTLANQRRCCQRAKGGPTQHGAAVHIAFSH